MGDDQKQEFLSEIDPEIKRDVIENQDVKVFLEAVQTTNITESIRITPNAWFYLTLIIFLLPSIWACISVAAGNSFPEKLFYDNCTNLSTPDVKYSALDCFLCCDNRTFIKESLVKKKDNPVKMIALIYTITIAVVTGPVYARLTLMEHIAIFLLPFGVVVRSSMSFSQLLPVLAFTLLFAGVAALNLISSINQSKLFVDVPLGANDRCNANSPLAGQVLVARFNDDNPSIAASNVPKTAVDYIKALLTIMIPFMPILLKMYTAVSTTYSKLGLEELVKDNDKSAATFDCLKYEVEENDLMKGIAKYATSFPPESKSCGALFHHLILFTCNWSSQLPEYWGMTWGSSEQDVQRVMMILKNEGVIQPYKTSTKGSGGGKVVRQKTTQAANIAPPPNASPIMTPQTPQSPSPPPQQLQQAPQISQDEV